MSEKAVWDATIDLMKGYQASLGKSWAYTFRNDPKLLSFVLSRYKFAAKMATQGRSVLELGCGEGIGATILGEHAASYFGVDFDTDSILHAQQTLPFEKYTFLEANFMGAQLGKFQTVVSLDVVEHIFPEHEATYFETIVSNLTEDGIAIVGTPNVTSQAYASKASQLGHVNLFSQERLKTTLERYFHNVFPFGLNDEIVHTGFAAMTHYVMCVACNKRSPL